MKEEHSAAEGLTRILTVQAFPVSTTLTCFSTLSHPASSIGVMFHINLSIEVPRYLGTNHPGPPPREYDPHPHTIPATPAFPSRMFCDPLRRLNLPHLQSTPRHPETTLRATPPLALLLARRQRKSRFSSCKPWFDVAAQTSEKKTQSNDGRWRYPIACTPAKPALPRCRQKWVDILVGLEQKFELAGRGSQGCAHVT